MSKPTAAPGAAELDVLFRPRSVAVIGASADPRRFGGRPVDFLKRSQFSGPIYPINPKRSEVQGLQAYASITDVPANVDHAIISVPVADALDAIEACVAKGVKGAVMFTAGFGEVGPEGRIIEDAIAKRCKESGLRLLGPNSLGFINVEQRVFSTFSGALDISWPKRGSIGVASQSGAFGMYCYTRLADRRLGISHFITTGNEVDVDVAECIGWLADDSTTHVILVYMESCRNGARLRNALAHAQVRRKPVVVMKGGVSEAGARAAASHTGALAGSDAGFQAVFDEMGAHRAASMDEMLDVAQALATGVIPKGRRVGIISVSGGAGVLMSDAASEYGLELPVLPDAAQAEIRRMIPFASPRNPIDSTAQVRNDFSVFARIIDIAVETGNFDTIVTFFAYTGQEPKGLDGVKPALFELRRRYPDKPVFVCMTATAEVKAEFEDAGLLVFADPRQVMRTIAALAHFAAPAPLKRLEPKAMPSGEGLPKGPLDEAAVKKILSAWKIRFVPERTVTTTERAVRAAEELGFPVALKIRSPDLVHKSDVGGVALGLEDAEAVATAWTKMMRSVADAAPTARISGALVSPMVTGGVETVLGIHRDPIFGPMVMFGIGGIFVEVYRDVAFRLAPIDKDAAVAMILSVKGKALLTGGRGRTPVDIDAIADTLVALSDFSLRYADAVESVDINPYIALPEGGYAVDAVIVQAAAQP
jgi:acyl-CoA synthetase (NDP forming)